MKSPAVLAAEAAAARAADKYVTRNGRPVASPKQVIAEKIERARADGDTPYEVGFLYRFIMQNYARRVRSNEVSAPAALDALAELTGMTRAQIQDAGLTQANAVVGKR